MLSDYLKGKITINISQKHRLRAIEQVAKKLEDEFHVKITIDKQNNAVIIEPTESTMLDELMKVKSIIEAINYGFSPEDALELKNEDYILEVIDLRDYVDKDKINHLIRIKGRIIGENGKAKRVIQELTNTKIVIDERAVAIIGPYENVKAAREAIEMLIRGRQHATVYRWLQNWRRELRRRELERLMQGGGEEFPVGLT